METTAARSVLLHTMRYFRRQLNPARNSGLVDQLLLASGVRVPGVEIGVNVRSQEILTREEVAIYGKVFGRDCANEGLVTQIRSSEESHRLALWHHLDVVNDVAGARDDVAGFVQLAGVGDGNLTLNSAQKERKRLLALVRSGGDLSRCHSDVFDSSREFSSPVAVVADCAVKACGDSSVGQAATLRQEGLSSLASLLASLGASYGSPLSLQVNTPLECDSVKRKRKKKMNKHKQRKLRRRDRHRN